jgi:hypothetical protein
MPHCILDAHVVREIPVSLTSAHILFVQFLGCCFRRLNFFKLTWTMPTTIKFVKSNDISFKVPNDILFDMPSEIDLSLRRQIEREDFWEGDDRPINEWPQQSRNDRRWGMRSGRGRIPRKSSWVESAEIRKQAKNESKYEDGEKWSRSRETILGRMEDFSFGCDCKAGDCGRMWPCGKVPCDPWMVELSEVQSRRERAAWSRTSWPVEGK